MNMYDLSGLPENYGYHKLLTVRTLSIDYKHRGSELFLRSSDLLEEVLSELSKCDMTLLDLIQKREMILRYIYDVPRDVFDSIESSNIINHHTLLPSVNFNVDCFNIVLDFALLVQYKSFIHPDVIKNSIVITNKASQRDMINYFIQHNLPLPVRFHNYTSFGELIDLSSDALTTVLVKHDTLTSSQIKTLWALNNYVYSIDQEDDRKFYYSFKFKTNKILDKAKVYK